jgi:hypothetical protein
MEARIREAVPEVQIVALQLRREMTGGAVVGVHVGATKSDGKRASLR